MRTRSWKKRVFAIVLAFTMVMGAVVVPVSYNYTSVEAATKKDTKKPNITMKGKEKMTVTKGKSVTIPKVTAKDNKDGNVTEATSSEETTTETLTTETQSTEQETTTESTTQEESKSETPTENVTPTDYSKYDMKDVTVNGVTYKTTRDTTFFSAIAAKYSYLDEDIKITVENDYMEFKLDKSEADSFSDASILLELMGNIKATDANGNDISDNIVIYDYALCETENKNYLLRIFVEDDRGYAALKQIVVMYITDLKTTYEDYDGILLRTEHTVLGYPNTITNE